MTPKPQAWAFRWNDDRRIESAVLVQESQALPGRWDVMVDGHARQWHLSTIVRIEPDAGKAAALRAGCKAAELAGEVAVDNGLIDRRGADSMVEWTIERLLGR